MLGLVCCVDTGRVGLGTSCHSSCTPLVPISFTSSQPGRGAAVPADNEVTIKHLKEVGAEDTGSPQEGAPVHLWRDSPKSKNGRSLPG